jgi:hypothetical protein
MGAWVTPRNTYYTECRCKGLEACLTYQVWAGVKDTVGPLASKNIAHWVGMGWDVVGGDGVWVWVYNPCEAG